MARFTAEGLADALSDADPQKDGKAPRPDGRRSRPKRPRPSASSTASSTTSQRVLKDEPKANTALLRGFSKFPSIPTMPELYKLRPAAIANYPMYKGLAKLLGMDVIDVGGETADLFDALEKNWAEPRFLLRPLQEDGRGRRGREVRGQGGGHRGDRPLHPAARSPSSPTSWSSPRTIRRRPASRATPGIPIRSCSCRRRPARRRRRLHGDGPARKGILGRFRSISAMPLMLAHALKLQKYGA